MQRSNQPARTLLFPAVPNVDCYAAVGSVETARARLDQLIRGAEGVGVLVGPTGTGKSLLCCLLAESLRDDFHVVLLADSQLTNGETLLKHILFHLNMPYRDLSEGELRLSLIDQLTQGMRGATKSALALIIDEAQTLSPPLLEEVRMITNIVRDGEPRVRTILAGSPELDDRLSDPKLESLNQRIASRCYLHPLTVEETARYVHGAAMRAGVNPGALIDDEALQVVFQATAGVPRLINQLMRQTIAINPASTIRADHVNRGWQSLQQLPSPYTDADTGALSEPHSTATGAKTAETPALAAGTSATPPIESSIVEFGVLRPDGEAEGDEGGAERAAAAETSADQQVDPIAAVNPSIAADLQRVTESLERLAGDRPETLDGEAQEEAVSVDVAWEAEAFGAATGEAMEAANLQFDCLAGEAEEGLPENYREAFGSEELTMDWHDEPQPAVEPIQELVVFESTLPPDSLELAAAEAGQERGTGRGETASERSGVAAHEATAWQASEAVSLSTSVDSVVQKVAPPVLPLEELFGADFDDEEAIPTERNYGTAFAAGWDSESARVPTDLEEEIRNQVLGILDATTASESWSDDGEADLIRGPGVEIAVEEANPRAASSDLPETVSFPQLSAECNEAATPDDAPLWDIQLSDDSDLLVIEETVDVEPIRIQDSLFDDDPSDSRDYQALLNRMRQG